MKIVFDFLIAHGPMLLAGVSALLGLASLLVLAHRQPIHRQRIAEGTMVLCLVFLVLACIPLPRFSVEMKAKPAPVKLVPLYLPQGGMR